MAKLLPRAKLVVIPGATHAVPYVAPLDLARELQEFLSKRGRRSIWREEIVTWKAGVTPVLVDEDAKIDALKKKGMITVKENGTILNCAIIRRRSGNPGGSPHPAPPSRPQCHPGPR